MDSLARAAAEREEYDKVVVRTHFGDDEAWQAVLALAAESWGDDEDADEEGFESTTYPVDDPTLAGASIEALRDTLASIDEYLSVVFIADEETMRHPLHPLLAVNLDDEPNYLDKEESVFGRQFRIVPRQASGLHVNLTLANMDYTDWADTAKNSADGVFTEFP
ncbi:DUF6924 domain-containing protein [Kutzneria chonburiensis]|jgi:hypothetical protein|uniref:DUF6924 domain-containing protein n=1 Tax=Kutzneria chonburiensis TaxID=1483604 RepID=A0ABV6MMJ7_9PSEU|nr:hypothetical protein [Kutzneria chonburiensis]